MKKWVFVFAAVLTLSLLRNNSVRAQDHQLTKIWQTDSVLKTPESVLFVPGSDLLFNSNINGDPSAKDGNGSIGTISTDGKKINVNWVTGLNAPKGLGLYQNKLYAADVDEVVVIDVKAAKIIQHIPIAGASFLNDITVDKKGIVYVSDTKTGMVHRIENGVATPYLDGLAGANGVLSVGDDLYILASGVLWKSSKDKNLVKIAEGMDNSTDGIELVKENEFIVSCWTGIVYYVKSDGSKQVLLDTRAQKINSADIGYDPVKMIVYVPNFLNNAVTAYSLK